MPYKYKPRKKKAGKRFAKPRNNKKVSRWTNLNVFNPGISDKMTVVLRYCETFRLDTMGLGIAASRNYRGNSVFDPRADPFGHQPMFFDQLSILYFHYNVSASRIVVKCVPVSDADDGAILIVTPTRVATASASGEGAMERPRSKYRLMQKASGGSVRIENNATSYQMLPRMLQDQLAQMTANPLEQWYWHVIIDNPTSGNEVRCDITVEINYTCHFSEKRNQSQS